ncbi:hypothetical protein IHE44_0000978, partial [Lamprotornis superbus]
MASVPSAGCLLAKNQYYRSECSAGPGAACCPQTHLPPFSPPFLSRGFGSASGGGRLSLPKPLPRKSKNDKWTEDLSEEVASFCLISSYTDFKNAVTTSQFLRSLQHEEPEIQQYMASLWPGAEYCTLAKCLAPYLCGNVMVSSKLILAASLAAKIMKQASVCTGQLLIILKLMLHMPAIADKLYASYGGLEGKQCLSVSNFSAAIVVISRVMVLLRILVSFTLKSWLKPSQKAAGLKPAQKLEQGETAGLLDQVGIVHRYVIF